MGWSGGVLYYYWQSLCLSPFWGFHPKIFNLLSCWLKWGKKMFAPACSLQSQKQRQLQKFVLPLLTWELVCMLPLSSWPFLWQAVKGLGRPQKAECQNTECQITDLLKMPKKWSKTKISSSHDFVKYGSKVAHGKSSKQKRLLSLPIYQGLSRERRLG